jgi:DMSO/TMAO reductase YedYZ molybdopterin-dependent catalytic subunit
MKKAAVNAMRKIMKNKAPLIYVLMAVFAVAGLAQASSPAVQISGEVATPLRLDIEDLSRFQTVRVQQNEVMEDGSYRGTFYYQGVPLKTLLDTASIQKKDMTFNKSNDLAIRVKNRDGDAVALSWGEIYYRNANDILIAIDAASIMPHKSCSSCHEPEEYEPRMAQFERAIGFPKLVLADDGYADRSIENVVSIEVIDPSHGLPVDRSAALSSPAFRIAGAVQKEITVTDLSAYPANELTVVHLGEGRGFHGVSDFSGTSFMRLLNAAGIEKDLAGIFLVSAPDGYRSTFSYGELFLKRTPPATIMADTENGRPIKEGGKFFLIPSEDLMSDRCVKSVEKIEVLTLKQ